jgi:peptidoglycan/LPS O-acetylase OafA/YrhL
VVPGARHIESVTGQRLRAIDAMRGIAALSVVFYHLFDFTPAGTELAAALPRWVAVIFDHGNLGVQVFFVLSGFVIALAVSSERVTLRYVAEFAVRRSIRLDPPYWTAMLIATALLAIAHRAPGLPSVLAHAVYLQNLLGYPNIVVVFWTLCYEVQFYLVLVVFVAIAQRLGRGAGWAVAIVPFMGSLWFLATATSAHGWFIDWWYAFAAGVATLGLLTRRIAPWVWWIAVGSVAAIGGVIGDSMPITVAVTAAVIAGLGSAGLLARLSGGPVLQWLGRISYSLYLTHFLAGAFAKVVGPTVHGPLAAAGLFILSAGVALAIAEVFYRVIERPSHQLSRRVAKRFAARPEGA